MDSPLLSGGQLARRPEEAQLQSLVRTSTGQTSIPGYPALIQRWESGVSICLKGWTGHYRKKAEEIKSLTDFWNRFQELENWTRTPTKELMSHIKSSLEPFEALSQKLQVPFDTTILWGTLSQILKILIDIDDVLYRFGQKLSLLSRDLEKFLKLQVTSPKSTATLDSCLDINLELLKFFFSSFSLFKNDPPETLAEKAWKDLDEHLKAACDAIKRNLDSIETIPREANEESRLQGLIDTNETLAMDRDQPNKIANLPIVVLPRAATQRFFDRTEIFQSIDEELNRGENGQDIALHGLNGVGKSEIALQYAHSRAKEYDAVLWVHSQTEATISQSFTDIAVKLGLEGATAKPTGYISNKVILLTWLQQTSAKWLLVYDNAEDADLLVDYWPVVKKGAVIVTTGNRSIAYYPASVGISIEAFDLENGSGLLLSLVRQQKNTAETGAAKGLTERLGGLPLAIYNVAGLISTQCWNISDFLKMYDRNRSKVHGYNRDGRKSLETNWQLTFDHLKAMPSALLGVMALLEAEEIPNDLFRIPKDAKEFPTEYSFLKDEFTFETNALGSLIELHLVKRGLDAGRLSVHRLVQHEFRSYVGTDKLQEMFNVASILLYEAFPQQKTGEQMQNTWSFCAAYLRHVLALFAVYRQSETEDHPLKPTVTFLELLANCAWHLYETTRYNQALDILDTATRAWDLLSEEIRKTDQTTYIKLCNHQGVTNHWLGNFEQSEQYYTKVLNMYRALFPKGGIYHLGNTYYNLGNLNASLGRLSKGLEYSLEAVKHIDGEPRLPSMAVKNLGLGRSYAMLGEYEAAKIYYDLCLDQNKQLDNWYMQGHLHRDIGDIAYHQGNLTSAEEHYHESQKLLTGVSGSRTSQLTGATYNRLGRLAQRKGNLPAAIAWYREALSISSFNLSCRGYKARALYMLAKALQQDSEHAQEAVDKLYEAQQLRKEILGFAHTVDGDDEVSAYDALVVIHVRGI